MPDGDGFSMPLTRLERRFAARTGITEQDVNRVMHALDKRWPHLLALPTALAIITLVLGAPLAWMLLLVATGILLRLVGDGVASFAASGPYLWIPVATAIALYLALRVYRTAREHLLVAALRRARQMTACLKCSYSLLGARAAVDGSVVCPECGTSSPLVRCTATSAH